MIELSEKKRKNFTQDAQLYPNSKTINISDIKKFDKDFEANSECKGATNSQSLGQKQKIQAVFRYRLKGVMDEVKKELESIDQDNKSLRLQLRKAKKHLIFRM